MDGLVEALRLLATGDEETWGITGLTLRISLTATAIALLVGMPLGAALALTRFLGRRVLLAGRTPGWGCRPSSSGCS